MSEAKKTSADKNAPLVRRRHVKLKKGSTMGNPPLTPLIDVFLFLIIFFLLSCQFQQAEGMIPANLPNTKGGPGPVGPPTPDPYFVTLTARANQGVVIDVEGRRFDDMNQLHAHLKQKMAGWGEVAKTTQPILIRPGMGVRWGSVVDAYNQAVRAEFTQVGVAPTGAPTGTPTPG